MRKRLLSLLLCLVILGSALPVQAKADTLTLPPPVDLKWGENMRSAWPSLYDDDTDFDMPDVISWDTTNLCDLAGQQISADCIIYRKRSANSVFQCGRMRMLVSNSHTSRVLVSASI